MNADISGRLSASVTPNAPTLPPVLAIVVPCFNEEAVLPETTRRLDALLGRLIQAGRIADGSHVCFVDDGSTDRTWQIIQDNQTVSRHFGGLQLSRNRGHQNALMAGLLAVQGDVIVSIDADLQDDLNAIDDMLRAHSDGAEIVYGVRSKRETDAFMKRMTAHLYYHLLQRLGVDIVFDHADFRLMSRNAIEALRQYQESNLFLRALVPQLGFQTAIVTYERAERFAGTSKYPLRKMLGLAIEGVTSFSTRPLRMVTILGCGMSALALLLTAWALFIALVMRAAVPGWASIVIPIYLVCGVQLLSLGIIGEYVGKIYLETKRRPRFIIARTVAPQEPSAAPGIGVAHRDDPGPQIKRAAETELVFAGAGEPQA
jgi:glycosyltransferase involved in cell wall biosynthesis